MLLSRWVSDDDAYSVAVLVSVGLDSYRPLGGPTEGVCEEPIDSGPAGRCALLASFGDSEGKRDKAHGLPDHELADPTDLHILKVREQSSEGGVLLEMVVKGAFGHTSESGGPLACTADRQDLGCAFQVWGKFGRIRRSLQTAGHGCIIAGLPTACRKRNRGHMALPFGPRRV